MSFCTPSNRSRMRSCMPPPMKDCMIERIESCMTVRVSSASGSKASV